MPLALREVEGYDVTNPTAPISSEKLKEWFEKCKNFKESEHTAKPDGFFTACIEAIHGDTPTRNYTRYMTSSFKKAIPTWTSPYPVPNIMYHNDYNGEVVGRIIEAKQGDSKRLPGAQALILTSAIPEWKDKEKVQNGLYSTVSIGVSATDVRCSICGAQLSEGDFCEHQRGYTYKNEETGKKETCYWDVYEWEAKEISFVIVPSDKYAGIVSYSYNYASDDESTTETEKPKGTPPARKWRMSGSEDNDASNTNKMTESQNSDSLLPPPTAKQESEGEKTLNIQEAEQKIASLETEAKALKGDAVVLQEKVDALNKDKVSLQESIAEMKTAVEEKDLALNHEKQLREAAESKVEGLEKEVKVSLAESLATLREKAGKPAIEKLADRSIDSLRDAITDIKAELKEAADKAAEEAKTAEEAKAAEEAKKAKGSVKENTLKESEETPGANVAEEAKSPAVAEDFDL